MSSSFVQIELMAQTKALRSRIEQLEKENKDLKRSLFDLALQHHAVVQEWGKTLPPGSPVFKKLVTVDPGRILNNPWVSSMMNAVSPFSNVNSSHLNVGIATSGSSLNSSAANVTGSNQASTSGDLVSSPTSPSPSSTTGSGSALSHIQHSASGSGLSNMASVSSEHNKSIVPENVDSSPSATSPSSTSSFPAASEAPNHQETSTSTSSSMSSAPLTASSIAMGRSFTMAGMKDRGKQSKAPKAMHFKFDLAGHTGAVYTLAFAPGAGRFLASGSFDKSVRIWDLWQAQTGGKAEAAALTDHQLPISALAWYNDANSLVSGSFDQTARIADVETGRTVSSFNVGGFVNSIALNPYQNSLMFISTNTKKIRVVDARVPDGVIRELVNKSIIHSSYMFRHGDYLMSADHQGVLRTWDTASGRVVHEFETDPARSTPISHITVCEPRESEEEGRLLAINSWDNVLRVYDRGKSMRQFYAQKAASSSMNGVTLPASTSGPATSSSPSIDKPSTSAPANSSSDSSSSKSEDSLSAPASVVSADSRIIVTSSYPSSSLSARELAKQNALLSPFNLTLLHECRSHRNKSWPIQSSFFVGSEYQGKSNWHPSFSQYLPSASSSSSSTGSADVSESAMSSSSPSRPINLAQSMLLATGSADQFAYLFDVGGPSGMATLVQRLEGHRDRVYVAQFHAQDPLLATASADCFVKIWGPKDSFFNNL